MKPNPVLRAHALFLVVAASACGALAAEEWQEASFPPPNAGRLAYVIMADGNPACATYDGANCLWGKGKAEIDFSKVRPLACGARHRELYGSTGFEDPKHWCNLALRLASASTRPAPPPPTSTAPSPAPSPPPAAPASPPPPAAGPRLTDWSPWTRAADVDYRYRVRWDPATGGPGKTVEAIFEIRNRGSKTWSGVARSLDCAQGTLWGSTDVRVGAQQTRESHVRAPNCGSARAADIRPNVVRQGKFD
jgi:hypothetical protein